MNGRPRGRPPAFFKEPKERESILKPIKMGELTPDERRGANARRFKANPQAWMRRNWGP